MIFHRRSKQHSDIRAFNRALVIVWLLLCIGLLIYRRHRDGPPLPAVQRR